MTDNPAAATGLLRGTRGRWSKQGHSSSWALTSNGTTVSACPTAVRDLLPAVRSGDDHLQHL